MKKNVSDPVHTNSFSKRSTFVSSKLRGFFWVHASRCIVFLNTYSSICECLIERNIKRYLNIKNISTCSFAIFVFYLRREALKKKCTTLSRHCFKKALFLIVVSTFDGVFESIRVHLKTHPFSSISVRTKGQKASKCTRFQTKTHKCWRVPNWHWSTNAANTTIAMITPVMIAMKNWYWWW